jgi:hypothetical protein
MLVLDRMESKDPRIAEFKRDVSFIGCYHKEESHVMDLKRENYYYCSKCRLFRKIQNVN